MYHLFGNMQPMGVAKWNLQRRELFALSMIDAFIESQVAYTEHSGTMDDADMPTTMTQRAGSKELSLII